MELLEQKEKLKLSMVTRAWKSSTWETEARGPGGQVYL